MTRNRLLGDQGDSVESQGWESVHEEYWQGRWKPALVCLLPLQRVVAELRHRQGLTFAKIGELVGRSPSSVWGVLQRAEKRRALWEEDALKTKMRLLRGLEDKESEP